MPLIIISDIDECTNDSCDVNAVCNNTRGTYNCTYNDGFYGDGKTCKGTCIDQENHNLLYRCMKIFCWVGSAA